MKDIGRFEKTLIRLRRIARRGFRISTKLVIGSESIILPPEHLLTDYQRLYPQYDSYFLPFFSLMSSRYIEGGVLVDIGANVGDTSLAVLSRWPKISVIAVEGSPYFLKYLRKNFESSQQVRIVDRFVTHKQGSWKILKNRGTAHLVEVDPHKDVVNTRETITPAEILGLVEPGNFCIWKSDTDGYDIPILLGSFDEITTSCEVLWIEFDPVGNLSTPTDVQNLIDRLATLPLEIVLFDNFGHLMGRFPCNEAPIRLADVVRWLQIQASEGTRVVPYVDLWVLKPELADLFYAPLAEAY